MIEKGTKVLVTGGTGFTGSVLVRKLIELGAHVRVIVRASSDRSALSDLPIEWVSGEVYDEEVINKACDSIEYVFHVAAAYRVAGLPDNIYWQVHVESTRRLARAAARSPSLRRFLHVSTVGVHGHIAQPPANEDAPLNPGDIYQRTKLEAENWIRQYAAETDLPVTIIRPAAIFGPGDTRLLKVFKLARLPMVPIIGFTRGLYHLIHVSDLVRFMLHAALADEARGQTYICGNAEPTSIRGMIESVAEELGTTPRFMRIPAWPVFLLAWLCEAVCRVIKIEPPIYRRRVAFFTKDRAFETGKMASLGGFQYQFTNKSGIVETCRAYQAAELL